MFTKQNDNCKHAHFHGEEHNSRRLSNTIMVQYTDNKQINKAQNSSNDESIELLNGGVKRVSTLTPALMKRIHLELPEQRGVQWEER